MVMNNKPQKPDSASIILAYPDKVETRLAELIPVQTAVPKRLQEALRYTLLAPGKRFRPLLTVLLATAKGYPESPALYDVACAGEMVHTASLILDDLPCMDNAPLRRNRPSAHVEFDESTAILTAVALLNRAFGVLARAELPADIRVDLTGRLSRAVGANGLIAGQLADLANDKADVSIAEVERLNQLKTGALFDFSVLASAVLCGLPQEEHNALADFSHQLGLAYQVLDDVKDVMMSEAQAEKTIGRDVGKATLVALTGCEASMIRLRRYLDNAYDALSRAGINPDAQIITVMKTQFAFAAP